MRRDFTIIPPLLCFCITLLSACNAPSVNVRPTLAFTEGDLLATVEAMPTFTPEISSALEEQNGDGVGGVWPTLIPTSEGDEYRYQTMAGDTIAGLSGRFGVRVEDISVGETISLSGYLPLGLSLHIPRMLDDVSASQRILPDGELVYASTAADFDIAGYIQRAGGYLNDHHEVVEEMDDLTGTQIIQRVASQLSVNPRLLLALLEYRSGWVYDHPPGAAQDRFPIGFNIPDRQGLYEELKIAATQLNLAYYGWRAGSFRQFNFEGGDMLRPDPTLNAGSVAVMHLFAILSTREAWGETLYAPDGFPVRYFNLFGDPWDRAEAMGPLIPTGLAQPVFELPFLPGEGWSLTAGPHYAWNTGTPMGALDFSPITVEEPCEDSSAWVTASAPGVAVRARDNVVALDLDGDGDEGSGWVLIYYHVAERDMIPEGLDLAADQRLGHPSCEGGTASGTHVHISRKYNGEWIAADGPVPFTMSGWRAVAGERIYQGQLMKGDLVVTADPAGRAGSTIIR